MQKLYKINAQDNVAVAITALDKNAAVQVDGQTIVLTAAVPTGHKVALQEIKTGADIIKYGLPIGSAAEDIQAGSWVHTHNAKSQLGAVLDYRYEPDPPVRLEPATYEFMGYKRPDGRVGIRNEVWIIPTVGCVNATARCMETAAQEFKTAAIDGIYAYSHPHGCSQLGSDHLYTQKFLAGLIRHPNAGAVLVVGLGCENNQIDDLKKVIGDYDERRVKFLVCQDCADEVAAGRVLLRQLCDYAAGFNREKCSADQLVIGLKCGGSDGFSGITANALVGAISDRLVAAGGTSILTEVPEMFGAETLLMKRCRNEAVFHKTVQLINDFKAYFLRYGEKINENPSPGNKRGGITTLEDKSLGCVQKGGTAIVEDVLGYGDCVQTRGLNLLQAPGNDLVAANALAAAGAHIVLFTTGRGTPFACPVPTLKIASNSQLAQYKKNWIDFDAGRLLSEQTLTQAGEEFFALLLEVASGRRQAKSELLDKHELAIFKDGVTL